MKFKSFKKLRWWLFGRLARISMPGHLRWHFVKRSGVNFPPPQQVSDKRFIFIGDNVTFDSANPSDIEIGNQAHITVGCVILSHYMEILPSGNIKWRYGKVKIGEHVFIGANSVITKPVTIGHHSIVGAGSVVTKDIPSCEFWGGVPARFIRKNDFYKHSQNTVPSDL